MVLRRGAGRTGGAAGAMRAGSACKQRTLPAFGSMLMGVEGGGVTEGEACAFERRRRG